MGKRDLKPGDEGEDTVRIDLDFKHSIFFSRVGQAVEREKEDEDEKHNRGDASAFTWHLKF
jgi:hypothetical protein